MIVSGRRKSGRRRSCSLPLQPRGAAKKAVAEKASTLCDDEFIRTAVPEAAVKSKEVQTLHRSATPTQGAPQSERAEQGRPWSAVRAWGAPGLFTVSGRTPVSFRWSHLDPGLNTGSGWGEIEGGEIPRPRESRLIPDPTTTGAYVSVCGSNKVNSKRKRKRNPSPFRGKL